jgi:hypothetical protein
VGERWSETEAEEVEAPAALVILRGRNLGAVALKLLMAEISRKSARERERERWRRRSNI